MPKSKAHSPQSYNSNVSQDQRILKTTLHGTGGITTDGAGIFGVAITLDPSIPFGSDWADFSSTYDGFRVMGIRIRIVSNFTNSATVLNNQMAIAFDNDSSAAPATLTTVQQYANSSTHSVVMTHNKGDPLTLTYWRPTSGAPIIWDDVATPGSALGSILIYGANLTPATAYLSYALEFYTEFRGRR